MVSFAVAIAILASYVTYSLAVAVIPRAFLGCSLLVDQIHCFGGFTVTVNDTSTSYNYRSSEHIKMDFTTLDYSNISTAQSNWIVQPMAASSPPLVRTGYLASASIAQQSKFLIYGGSGIHGLLKNPVMIFDPATAIWTPVPTFGNYSRFSPVVDLGTSSQLWTWGGLFNDTQIANGNGQLLNYELGLWKPYPKDPSTSYVRVQHTATLVPSENTIYIIGGIRKDTLTNSSGVGADMLEILTFDTIGLHWLPKKAITSNGQNIMPRTHHTTSLISGTTSFFIFGGDSADTASTTIPIDYAYLFDYTTRVYTPLRFKEGSGPKARTGHEAISYKSYVIIMFGVNSQHELLNDFYVLNATNLSSLYWLDGPLPTSDSDNPIIYKPEEKDTGLTGGALAGVSVGAAVVGIVLTAILIYFLIRKRKQKREFELETTDPRQMMELENHRGSAVPFTEPTLVEYQSVPINKGSWPSFHHPRASLDTPSLVSPTLKPFNHEKPHHYGKPDGTD